MLKIVALFIGRCAKHLIDKTIDESLEKVN